MTGNRRLEHWKHAIDRARDKGATYNLASLLADFVNNLCVGKFRLRCDNEPSIMAVTEKVKAKMPDTAPRVDAQASDSRTGIGGWFPARDREGRLSPWLSSWFYGNYTRRLSMDLRQGLVISTLEAFAMLVALKLRFGHPDPEDTRVMIAPSITDNRGNGEALIYWDYCFRVVYSLQRYSWWFALLLLVVAPAWIEEFRKSSPSSAHPS